VADEAALTMAEHVDAASLTVADNPGGEGVEMHPDESKVLAIERDMVGRCRLPVSKPVLRANMVSALDTII